MQKIRGESAPPVTLKAAHEPQFPITSKAVRPEIVEGPFMVRQAHHERPLLSGFTQWIIGHEILLDADRRIAFRLHGRVRQTRRAAFLLYRTGAVPFAVRPAAGVCHHAPVAYPRRYAALARPPVAQPLRLGGAGAVLLLHHRDRKST